MQERRADRATYGLLACGMVGIVLLGALAPFDTVLLRLMPDDAFYYLEIARRYARGEGSTFDGINLTNGYHPLWLTVIVPFAQLMDQNRELGARAVFCLSGGLLTAALAILRRALAHDSSLNLPANASILFVFAVLISSSIYGMESALAAFFLSILLYLSLKLEITKSWAFAAAAGFASGLLVLSRLDAAVYVLFFNLIWLIRCSLTSPPTRRREILQWSTCLLVQLSIVLPYAVHNYLEFGHPLTISARIKTGRAQGLSLDWLKSVLAYLGVLSGVLSIGNLHWMRRHSARPAIWVAAGGTLSMLLFAVLKGGKESYNWYFTLPVLCLGLLLSGLQLQMHRIRLFTPLFTHRLLTGVAGGLALVLVVQKARHPSQFLEQYQRASWIRAHAPSDAIFAYTDCGILGYFSAHSVVNLDGLTNGLEWQEAIHEDGVPEYLSAVGVNAMVLRPTREGGPSLFARGRDHFVQLNIPVGMQGDKREVYATLAPWPGQKEDERYQLWWIQRFERGRIPADAVRVEPD